MAVFSLVLSLAGCGSSEKPTMPDVQGQQLDVALSDIKRAGIDDEAEIVGGGLLGVLDESNWQVCSQSPGPGQSVTVQPRLTVDRACSDDEPEPGVSTSSPAPESAPTPSDAPVTEAPPTDETLTAKNNPEFAALLSLTDTGSSTIEKFATKYAGRTLDFDGNICAMNKHGDYATRFDILICAGDFSEISSRGPNFQFKDVNVTNDIHVTGPNIPDTLAVGQNVGVVAKVEGFNGIQELFFLDPVQTTFR
mgnify:FL=1